ncbi:hypothetical protein [Faecousia sp.]|uniref:hypothetical protein n=1 Tax=Faecousia sp. TaxID=2952921 RepID=UPI0039F743FF
MVISFFAQLAGIREALIAAALPFNHPSMLIIQHCTKISTVPKNFWRVCRFFLRCYSFAGFPPIVRRFGRKTCGKMGVSPDSAVFFPPAGRKIRVKRGVRHLQFVQGNDKNVQADCVCSGGQ